MIDWTASLPFRRDLSEVGSIGHPKPLGETMEPWDSSTSSSPSSSASPPAIIGRAKGSSFWLWLLVGTVLPLLGLIAVILYRARRTNPNASARPATRRSSSTSRSARAAARTSTCPTRPRSATPASQLTRR